MPEARAFRRAGRGKSAPPVLESFQESRTREICTSGSTRGEWVAAWPSPSLLLYRLRPRFPAGPRRDGLFVDRPSRDQFLEARPLPHDGLVALGPGGDAAHLHAHPALQKCQVVLRLSRQLVVRIDAERRGPPDRKSVVSGRRVAPR